MGLDRYDEARFIRALKKGDKNAFARLLDRCQKKVFNLCVRLLGDMAEAEDATQDVFVEVYRSLSKFRGLSKLDTWVYRIGVNVCLQRRRRKRAMAQPLTGNEAGARDPLSEAIRTETGRAIHQALRTLPQAQRDVVMLHELDGLTYQEVAMALGCPVGTVKSRLSTAFSRLRLTLQSATQQDVEVVAMPSIQGQASG